MPLRRNKDYRVDLLAVLKSRACWSVEQYEQAVQTDAERFGCTEETEAGRIKQNFQLSNFRGDNKGGFVFLNRFKSPLPN